MKKTRYTGGQIAFALKQAEVGTRVEEDNHRLKRLVAALSLDKEMFRMSFEKSFEAVQKR